MENSYEKGMAEGYTESGRKKVSAYVKHYYGDLGYNCAEATLYAANDAWDLQLHPSVFATMAGFGGGMGVGDLCGAASGGVAAMGYLYATETANKSPLLRAKVRLFIKLIQERLGDENCKVLAPKFKTKEEKCLLTVLAICDILDEVVDTEVKLPQKK